MLEDLATEATTLAGESEQTPPAGDPGALAKSSAANGGGAVDETSEVASR